MVPSVSHNVDVLIQAGLEYRLGSDVIVLIEAEGFYWRKCGNYSFSIMINGSWEGAFMTWYRTTRRYAES